LIAETPMWYIEDSQNLSSINPLYFVRTTLLTFNNNSPQQPQPQQETPSKKIEHDDHNITWYKEFFEGKKHKNLMGIDPLLGPIIISVMKDDSEDQSKKSWKILYRSKDVLSPSPLNTTQHNTTQHNTTQHNATLHYTTLHYTRQH